VRVIAATNRDLQEAVGAGRFRADLFYRLHVFPIEVPPLRARRSDIPQLVTFFVSRLAKKFGKRVGSLSPETMEHLASYAWPGNIRELQNVIERAVVLCEGPILELGRDLAPITAAAGHAPRPETPPESTGPRVGSGQARQAASQSEPSDLVTLEEVERRHVLSVLTRTGGVIHGPRGAARILGLHPNTLRSRMEKLGIVVTRARPEESQSSRALQQGDAASDSHHEIVTAGCPTAWSPPGITKYRRTLLSPVDSHLIENPNIQVTWPANGCPRTPGHASCQWRGRSG
jgi:formate hydrogenlyase transcriptional activator